jgi:hypothetical protein
MKISLGAINEIINLSGDTTTKSYRNTKKNYINSLKERSDYLDKYLI